MDAPGSPTPAEFVPLVVDAPDPTPTCDARSRRIEAHGGAVMAAFEQGRDQRLNENGEKLDTRKNPVDLRVSGASDVSGMSFRPGPDRSDTAPVRALTGDFAGTQPVAARRS